MGPEVGFGIGQDGSDAKSARPRPSAFVRAFEIVGLVLVIYGLAVSRYGLVAAGVLLIVTSYALFRRRNGPGLTGEPDKGTNLTDEDGGGD